MMVDFDDGDYCKRCEGPWTAHWLSDPRSDRDGAVDFVVFCPDDVDVNKWDDDPDEWGFAYVGAHWYDLLGRLPSQTSTAAAEWLLADFEKRQGKHVVTAYRLDSVDLMDRMVRKAVGPMHSIGASKCEACPPGWPATHPGCDQSRPTVHAAVIDRYARRALTGRVNWLDQGGLRSVYSESSDLRVEAVCEVCGLRRVHRETWKQVREAASAHPQWAPHPK